MKKKIAFEHGAAFAEAYAYRSARAIFSREGETVKGIRFWHGPGYVKAFLAGAASVVIGEGC